MAQKVLYGDYLTQTYSSLFAEGDFARVEGLAIAAGQGDLVAGSILYRHTDDTYKFAASTDVVSGKYFAILGVNVSTGAADDDDTTPSTAACYSAGVFLSDKLLLKSGTLNAAGLAALRDQNILLKSYVKNTGVPSDTIS